MRTYASRADVTRFLSKVKKCVDERNYTFVPREKNLQTLADLELRISEAMGIVRELNVRDYYEGPEPDLDWDEYEGEVWFFGGRYGSKPLYLKLKIVGSHLVCISFHHAAPPLYGPYR